MQIIVDTDTVFRDVANAISGAPHPFKEDRKSKIDMADLTLSITAETSPFTTAIDKAKKGLESLAKVDLKELSKKIGEAAAKITQIGAGLSGVGSFLTKNLTGPLTIGLALATKELDAKMKTLNDRVKLLFSKLFEPAVPYFEKGVDMLIGIVDRAIAWFQNTPESMRVFVAIAASAAAVIGPVLVTIGGALTGAVTAITSFVAAIGTIVAGGTVSVVIAAIAAAIALLVVGIGIAIGVVYGLVEAWQNGFGPIASVVAIAIGVIVTAFSPILGLPILIGAMLATLYEMWATNFGGLQDLTTEAWGTIEEYINSAMTAIQQLVADIGGDIVAWWNENYPLIQQTVQTVSDAVRACIQNFLTAVKGFWDAHGEQIMSVVRSMWTIISTIVRTGVQVIMQVVRLVLQLINGDWAGAWNTAKDIVSKIVTAIGAVLKEFANIATQALKFVVTAIVNWGTEVIGKAADIGRNIVRGIISGITSLAGKLLEYGKNLIGSLFSSMNRAAETHSPSLVTTRMGMFIGEGLVVGLRAMLGPVARAGKDLIAQGLGNMGKEAKKVYDEFQKYRQELESDPQKQKDLVTIADYGDAKSKLDELVKLRIELNQNVGNALPKNLHDINEELTELGKQKQGIQDAADMLTQFESELDKIRNKDVRKTNVDKVNDLLNDPVRGRNIQGDRQKLLDKARELDEANNLEAVNAAREQLNQTMGGTIAQLTDEIALLEKKKAANFAMTEQQQAAFVQQQKNAEALQKYRESLKNDPLLSPDDINQLVADMQKQQDTIEQLRAQKESLAAQDKLYTDTMKGMDATLEQLNQKLADNTNRTDQDVLAKVRLTDAYQQLTDAQKKNLETRADEIEKKRKQVEELENAKKQMDEFKGFIKDSLNTLVNQGFGAMFKSILDKFKKMLIDMATEWISSQIYKLLKGDGSGKGGFGDIINSVFGFFTGGKGVAASGGGGGEGAGPHTGGGNVGHEGAHADIGKLADAASEARGLFDPMKNIVTGKTSALAGKLSGIGAIATMVGGFLPGKLGNVVSMAGMGLSIGANFGPWGAAIGAAAGAIIGLFMGDPKKKIDKKENLPKLQQGFTEALQQLRDLLNDRNAIFSDPDGAIATAMDIRGKIAGGFGIEFQSKKYKKVAQQQIAQKLVEADALIKQIKEMADVARMANKVDSRLEAEFATGIFADRAFIRQHADFKRRNGLLSGAFTGRDTLPSMLAPGEMVLNPRQIDRVRSNAGFDAFKGAGIPNYATAGFISGNTGGVSPAPVSISAPPVTVQIVVNNSGLVESDIKGVLVNGLKSSDVQVELVKAYDKGKTRVK